MKICRGHRLVINHGSIMFILERTAEHQRVIHMSNLASVVHAGLKILTVILWLCADVKKKTLRFLEHLLKQRDSVELGKGRHGNKPGRTADFSD